VAGAIKPDDAHFARTRLLCLENTQGGKVLPLDYLRRAHDFARARGLGLHLDGARLFNAVVRQGVEAADIGRLFDTVSVCLSKGLGAPVGSVLCGSREHIAKARRWRKVLGGGMRQAGVVAAAGIYALENHIERLAEDHANARSLAQGLAGVRGVQVDPQAVQTNMVFVSVAPDRADALRAFLKARGMLIGGGSTIRLVTHLDVDAVGIRALVDAVREFFATEPVGRAAAVY
jgi:threonine aldolase